MVCERLRITCFYWKRGSAKNENIDLKSNVSNWTTKTYLFLKNYAQDIHYQKTVSWFFTII